MDFRDHDSACLSKSPREGERGRGRVGVREWERGGESLSKSHERRGDSEREGGGERMRARGRVARRGEEKVREN